MQNAMRTASQFFAKRNGVSQIGKLAKLSFWPKNIVM